MKISEAQIENVIRFLNEKKMKKEPTNTNDAFLFPTTSLSSVSVEIRKYHDKYHEIPNMREHIILDIQKKIKNGTYQIQGYDIVKKMMGRDVADLIADTPDE